MSAETVREWQKMYRVIGRGGLLAMGVKRAKYDYETKVAAARAVVDGGMSKPEAMVRFGIASATPLKQWCRLYREGGVQALAPGAGMARLLFVLGVVASATMVIPGVSGSMVLMILGYYYGILNSVTGLLTSLKALDWAGVARGMLLLVPFGLGVLLGIFLIAKLINYLFEHFPTHTYCAIIGLIVSSPFAILYSAGVFSAGFSWGGLAVGLLLGAAGAVGTYFMGEKE